MPSSEPPASSINGWNAEYLDSQYQQWKRDRHSVGPEWSFFFQGLELGSDGRMPAAGAPAGSTPGHVPTGAGPINHFRSMGHTVAHLDPLSPPPDRSRFLVPEDFGFTSNDLDVTVDATMLAGGSWMTRRDLHALLERIYCGTVGIEFMHITRREERLWLAERFERTFAEPSLSREDRLDVLTALEKAETFERFVQQNYTGQKRFSLEGGETLVALLDDLVESAANSGVTEFVLGMAHRGRLNVLANIMDKSYALIFTEFEDIAKEDWWEASGDVKYHKGASTNKTTRAGHTIHLTMTSNPSHLEMVGAVVEGRTRAKQDGTDDQSRERVVPVVMHGDGAFIGQGIVAETFNMSQLEGYTTGGTIHIVINNQVAFTTAVKNSRSTLYCTDIAKIIEAPVFHVNAEDPEAAVLVARLALEYRQKFRRDVVIDIVCYRKFGHNEADEPSFTQPRMYEVIRAKKSIRELYLQKLLDQGMITAEDFSRLEKEFEAMLEKAQKDAKAHSVEKPKDVFGQGWVGFEDEYRHDTVVTGVAKDRLLEIARRINSLPESLNANTKVRRVLQDRLKAIEKGSGIDWANGEALSFATLLLEGHDVRLSGQDCRRATFSQRHAALYDQQTEVPYFPLRNLGAKQGSFDVFDSPLSELSVLAYEYGYSLVAPETLVLWEAQFGDFANCAQAIIDEFIASAETKWERFSGLVMLLPHGYEGQGPDHSSARPERFLQLCAFDNMIVSYPSTPAQYFHVLRRQMKRRFRRPLILMTPKSLLRLPAAASNLDDFAEGTSFQEVLPDPKVAAPTAKRIVLCAGKVYYDLLKRREEQGNSDTALVRLEQWYPFPKGPLASVLGNVPAETQLVYVQEEPWNMGAWTFLEPRFREFFGREVEYVGRPEAATPATGSHHTHELEQDHIVSSIFPPAQAANHRNGNDSTRKRMVYRR